MVLPAQIGRHVDELDRPGPARGIADGVGEVQIAARLAGADIEQPVHTRRVQQPEHHVDDIANPDEVPLLLAVGQIRLVGAEQAHRQPLGQFVVFDLHDRNHRALVVLVRAVDVEELQAGPLRRPGGAIGQVTRHQAIELVL